MANEVKFKYGTLTEYDGVVADESTVESNIYFTTESAGDSTIGTIYRGDEIMGTSAADKLFLPDEFTVTGTSAGLLSDGTTIPAGTSIVELLKQMLQQEITPTSITAPTSTTTATISPTSTTTEVGSTITATVKSVYTDAKFATYTDSNKVSTTSTSMGTTLDGGYTISRKTPSVLELGTGIASGTTVSDTVSLTTEGAALVYTATANRTGANYTVMSNMGNTTDKTYASGTTSDDSPTCCTAYYRYYYGTLETADIDEVDQSSLSSLTNALLNATKTLGSGTGAGDGKMFVVAIPSTKTFTCFDGLALTTDWVAEGKFSEKTLSYTIGDTTTEYTIYYMTGGEVSYSALTINK